jgi:cysteine desulfurase
VSAPHSPTRPLYFDWNATTPLHPEAIEAMREAIADGWGNPSSVHSAGRRARAIVEDGREAVARLAGVDPRDVVLTSGATEANNIALGDATALRRRGGSIPMTLLARSPMCRAALASHSPP